MFDFNNICNGRLQKCLVLQIAVILFAVTCCCYNPCPESLRGTVAENSCNIPSNEVEKAFQQANVIYRNKIKQEKDLVSKGKIVNKKIKSSESTHPQAMGTARNRQMGLRQLVLQEASIILTKKYNLTTEQVCCSLSKLTLTEPSAASAVRRCVSNDTPVCDPSARYRTMDGTCNNLDNPTWGSAFSCFNRILPPVYTENDGFRLSVSGAPLPAPRALSVNVHSNMNRPTNYVDHLYMFFGQMLDHDFTLTAASVTENNEAIECCPPSPDDHPQCAPVLIPTNDPFYSQSSVNVTCLNFVRSGICPYCTTGPRVQVNEKTAYIDASQVYGNSVNESNGLRTNDGTGMLRVQNIPNVGDLLPPSPDPQNDQCSDPAANEICFLAGDQRANQHATLTSLHTLFVREHNRLATQLRSINPQWDEETLFQEARRIVGAEMQMITYCEFLPVTLGSERMTYFNLWISNGRTYYNRSVDATLLTEFSTAVFRFGHSTINSWVAEQQPYDNHRGLLLRNMFFFPFGMYTGEMDPLLNGSTQSPAQWFDRYMVSDVTNFLYRIRNQTSGSDLASFNVQRGRDHGLQPYSEYVTWCSQRQIVLQSFTDLVRYRLMTTENMNILRSIYRYVQDIDLFTGILSEIPNDGAVIGPTGICIVGIQFWKIKYGDRFYFEHTGQSGSFTTAQINEIKKVTLAKIMCDNSGITSIQRRAMIWSSNNNPRIPCNQLQAMNLGAWRQR